MACRKWVIRSLVFVLAATAAAGLLAYQQWTNPLAVRRQVLDKLLAKCPGASITLESARLRLLGGIAVRELRMVRRDDSDNVVFLYVPSAVIYHDKELLLEGQLSIRKMELDRPRMRVRRERDGSWSLAGVLAPPDLRERIPTIIAHHATIVVEDRLALPGTPPLEIKDIDLKIINDPALTVTFEATGGSELVGPVELDGTWQRDTGATALHFAASSVPVAPGLIGRLASICPDVLAHLRELWGTGALQASANYRPDTPQPWSYDLSFTLGRGRFRHRQLPYLIEEVEGSLRCTDGRIPGLEIRARSGMATLHVTAEDVDWTQVSPRGNCSPAIERLCRKLDVKIENLPITRDFFELLPQTYRSIYDEFLPSGALNITYALRREDQGPPHKRMLIEPQGMRVTYAQFPYTVERLTGTLEQNSDGATTDLTRVNMVAYSGSRRIRIKGDVRGEKPNHSADLDIWGEDIPLDNHLLFALTVASPKCAALAQSFHPTGLANFHVHAHRTPETDCYHNHYSITFHHASICYEPFPFRIDNISGVLEIQPDNSFEFRDFQGTHGNAVFSTRGRSVQREDGEYVHVNIGGRAVTLDDNLRTALPQELQRTWKSFNLAGRVDFDGTLTIPPQQPDGPKVKPALDLTVQARGCTIQPEFFRYALTKLNGKIHYAQDTVELENLIASHAGTLVHVNRGVVLLRPGGGFQADLTYLHATPLIVDADFLQALHEPLRKGLTALSVKGPLELHTRLYIDAPPGTEPARLFWDGSVVFHDTSLRTGVPLEHVTGIIAARGWSNGNRLQWALGNLDVRQVSLFNQPLRNIRGEIIVSEDEPDVLKLPGLMIDYFGGQIYGPVRIEFEPKVSYEVNLTAAQVRLEEFGRHNFGGTTQFTGQATARLYLRGDGTELSGLRGAGRLDVPSGKLYNLPLLLDLLKFLGLRLPDRTAFEEAHATFDIEGKRAHVHRLELYGNAISLRGQGDLNLDGSDLNLDFNVDWARLGQILPASVRVIPREISNQLLKIEMRGRFGDVRFNKQPIPLLTDPLRKLLNADGDSLRTEDREKGRQGERKP
jgi:hypothetical protein